MAKRRIKIHNYQSIKYREVFEILEWKGSQIYRTKSTGLHIHVDDARLLDSQKYAPCTVSTVLTALPSFEIEIGELEDFS